VYRIEYSTGGFGFDCVLLLEAAFLAGLEAAAADITLPFDAAERNHPSEASDLKVFPRSS
jgi:hypothetical protein